MKDAVREYPTFPIKRVYDKVARAMNRVVTGNIYQNSIELEHQ
jgi:hypothetical protein